MSACLRWSAVFIALLVMPWLPASAAGGNPSVPFVVTASAGPAAGSHIDATVTRIVGKTTVTLPAALVPALKPGDIVDLDFPDYRRPPSSVNYHVNVAFVTETARQHWLFERSSPADRLFSNARRKAKTAPASGRIHFVYGAGDYRGIPIFFLIPEDAKTRGVDGVRDYVGAHPTDFVDMSQGTNAAVDRYSFLSDFLSSLGSGSMDPISEQYRVESVAQSLGVSASTIDACYVAGEPAAEVSNCVQQAVDATIYQTNFAAPTQAQFLGGVAGAALPLTYAPYLASLLTVWHLFVKTGHLEYEYLPTTVTLADPTAARGDELLMGVKVPTVRPPAAYSDVLFFTIGDPQATEHAPLVVNDAPGTGVCERSDRFTIPLHFDHTSRYVNGASLLVSPDGHAPYRLALDPRTLSAPLVERSRFAASADGGYSVALSGRFGFDPVSPPENAAMRLAFPGDGPWSLATVPHHPPVAGESLDVIASSATAACLSHAEMQIGSAAPIALTAKQLDAGRVELSASLTGISPGPAEIRLYEDGPRSGRAFEASVALSIQAPPAQVDAKTAVVSLGDAFISLAGSGLETVRGIVANGATYVKEANSSATSACFDGPPFGGDGLAIGQRVTAQLTSNAGTGGEVFPLTVVAPRPRLAAAGFGNPSSGPHLSTSPVVVTLASASGTLPRQVNVRVRQAGATPSTPCEASRPDPTAVAVADADVHARTPGTLTIDLHPNLLRDRAFGTLQMQLVDAATGLGSNWVPLPGTFARAPEVTQIACPATPSAMCRMYGTGLAAIDAVEDATGAYVAPGLDCPPTDKGLACVYVPRVAHYTLRLIDAATIETLPDELTVGAS